VGFLGVDIYDPTTQQWSPGPWLNASTSMASTLAGGQVVALDIPTTYTTGLPNGFYTCSSPTASTFTSVTGSTPTLLGTRIAGLNGQVYMVGGLSVNQAIGDCGRLDASALGGAVVPLAPLATKRAYCCAVASGGKIYAIGGVTTAPLLTPFGTTYSQTASGVLEEFTP
jgi:hypothetical protein